ncbi:AEC family transporter [Planococcaceae bacterium Storch 2/2-2]|nr:AEC family transporter [Planococcaceae bacterium Storch 2/2-2]
MNYLLAIVTEIIGPILALIVLGGVLQRKFSFHLRTLSHLVTYALLPATVFLNLYETKMDQQLFIDLVSFLLLFIIGGMLMSVLVSRTLRLDRETSAVFQNSVVLVNAGNYGIPVSQMVFSAQPIGITIQFMVMVIQNVTTYTFGLSNLIATRKTGLEIIRELLRLPLIHALWIGAIFNLMNWTPPITLLTTIEYVGSGFLPVALILLGAQLSQIELKTMFHPVIYWSAGLRLIGGPILAYGLLSLLGITGVVAKSLFIASAFPTSRNSSTLAFEYDVQADLAAQMVLFSTVLSAITVTATIFLADLLW